MHLPTKPYIEQARIWPPEGRHILAHYDANSIIVYQAYNHAIADHAVATGRLAGPHYNLTRMSWIKPNFLWMMYRAGWATKLNHERILAIRLPRARFDAIVAAASLQRSTRSVTPRVIHGRACLRTRDGRLDALMPHA